MRHAGTAVAVLLLAAGCAPRDVAPAHNDSLLATPAAVDTHATPTVLPNGLVLDSSRMLDTAQAKALSRFTPKQILTIYQAYRPLRRSDLSQSQLDTFLSQQKISHGELHAILEQGDRLGWNSVSR